MSLDKKRAWLARELLGKKSGYATWSQMSEQRWDLWTMERLGALVRVPDATQVRRSEAELVAMADKVLKRDGDRGWGALCATLDAAEATWLACGWGSHPVNMRQWPEATIRTMTMLKQLQPELSFMRIMNATETLWGDADQRLARWLTGRSWARGDRVAQVLFEAGFRAGHEAADDDQIHHLWRRLQSAMRERSDRVRLTEDCVHYLMTHVGPKEHNRWFRHLRQLRMYGTVRLD